MVANTFPPPLPNEDAYSQKNKTKAKKNEYEYYETNIESLAIKKNYYHKKSFSYNIYSNDSDSVERFQNLTNAKKYVNKRQSMSTQGFFIELKRKKIQEMIDKGIIEDYRLQKTDRPAFLKLVYDKALELLNAMAKRLKPSEKLQQKTAAKTNYSSLTTEEEKKEFLNTLYQRTYGPIVKQIATHNTLAFQQDLIHIAQKIEQVFGLVSVYESLSPERKFLVEKTYPNLLSELTQQCAKAHENEKLTGQKDDILPLALQTLAEQIDAIFTEKHENDKKSSQVLYQYLKQKR